MTIDRRLGIIAELFVLISFSLALDVPASPLCFSS
jgi:hypothetical protein